MRPVAQRAAFCVAGVVFLALGACRGGPVSEPAGDKVPARAKSAPPALPAIPSTPVPAACTPDPDITLLTLEREAVSDRQLRILAVSERPLHGPRLRVGTETLAPSWTFTAGPPYAALFTRTAPLQAGHYTYHLEQKGRKKTACLEVWVQAWATLAPRAAPKRGVWRVRRQWTAAWERVYSIWIAHLFRSLPEKRREWYPLHQVLLHRERNFLWGRLGLGEDDRKSKRRIVAWADCGDTPYQLRAYFAWKFELPFRLRRCTRGSGTRGPWCYRTIGNETRRYDRRAHPVARFNAFLRYGIAWNVHSGTTRTVPEDERSDFYPIALDRRAIRPGTIWVDVGGHLLVVTRWEGQTIHAIDGHPDLSVTRREFRPKFFRYFLGTRTGGFKAFRPIRRRGPRVVPLPNRELRWYSIAQYRFPTRRAFYRHMNRLLAAGG